jgi:hypothetical protein
VEYRGQGPGVSYLKAVHGIAFRSPSLVLLLLGITHRPTADEVIARARARVHRSKTVLDVEAILAARDADRRDEQIELQLAEASGLTVGSPLPQSPGGDDPAQPEDDPRRQEDGPPQVGAAEPRRPAVRSCTPWMTSHSPTRKSTASFQSGRRHTDADGLPDPDAGPLAGGASWRRSSRS